MLTNAIRNFYYKMDSTPHLFLGIFKTLCKEVDILEGGDETLLLTRGQRVEWFL